MTGAGGDSADPLPNPKDYWSNRVAGWSDDTPEGLPSDDTFDRALMDASAIISGMDVLDLAAGSGDPSVTIAAHLAGNGSVTAYDMTYDRLIKARGRGDNLAFGNFWIVSGDMTALPFPDASFDAVTCRNGLMFPDDKPACVAEARRVLKPGAKGSSCDSRSRRVTLSPGSTPVTSHTESHAACCAASQLRSVRDRRRPCSSRYHSITLRPCTRYWYTDHGVASCSVSEESTKSFVKRLHSMPKRSTAY